MVMTDFVYDNKRLSDFGCMVAYLNTAPPSLVPMGSVLTLNVTKNISTQKNLISGTSYEEPVTATFDIVKSTCNNRNSNNNKNSNDNNNIYFSDAELNHFMRWLNRKKYFKFKPIYSDDEFPSLYYYGTFTAISLITVGGHAAGLTVTFTANSPFGYTDDTELKISIPEENGTFKFYNDSDETGILYPSRFIIKCLKSGKLIVSNSLDRFYTLIDNCEENEIITMDCENKIIESSKAHPALFNDFNYNYPRFISTEDSRFNIFTFSLPCDISITYNSVRKVGIIV